MHPGYQFWPSTKDISFQINYLFNITISQIVFEEIPWNKTMNSVTRELEYAVWIYTRALKKGWKKLFATSKESK